MLAFPPGLKCRGVKRADIQALVRQLMRTRRQQQQGAAAAAEDSNALQVGRLTGGRWQHGLCGAWLAGRLADERGVAWPASVQQQQLPAASVEVLQGHDIFVCCHTVRDARCASCGPRLVEWLRQRVSERGLQQTVRVWACSHIGGHR